MQRNNYTDPASHLKLESFVKRSSTLFNSLKTDGVYHDKHHGNDTAIVARAIARDLKLPEYEVAIAGEAARWHDVGCFLPDKYYKHEITTLHYILGDLSKLDSRNSKYYHAIAEVLKNKPSFISNQEIPIIRANLSYIVEVADYLSQCGHSCYIPMLKPLYEICIADEKAFGKDDNPFGTIDKFFYDDYIYKAILPVLQNYFKLPSIKVCCKVFQLNMEIREFCRVHCVTFADVIALFDKVSGKMCEAPLWDLKITPAQVQNVLHLLQENSNY